VTLGQAEVAALTAHNTAAVEKVKLWQQIGVQPPSGPVQLTTTFAVAKPTFSLDSVLDLARRVNPAVLALREREHAAGWNVRVAQSAYTPTLALSTGWSGTSFQYTNSDFPVQQVISSNLRGLAGCMSQDSIRTRLSQPLSSLDCNNGRFALTPDQASQIRSENSQFPFKFQRAPLSFSATLSIPIFDNFSREQRVEQAHVDLRQRAIDRQVSRAADDG
jgi:outer membrane protein